MEHQISEIMKLSLENIRDLIDVNVIVGKENECSIFENMGFNA